jgi:hypothetical protein
MWACLSRQAFSVVQDPMFRDLIGEVSQEAAEVIPQSRNTVRSWIINEFKK